MPTYEYRCPACRRITELVITGLEASPPARVACRYCAGVAKRQYSAPHVFVSGDEDITRVMDAGGTTTEVRRPK